MTDKREQSDWIYRQPLILAAVSVLVLWIPLYFWAMDAFTSNQMTALRVENGAVASSYGSALGSALHERLSLVEGLAAFVTVKATAPGEQLARAMQDEFPQFAAALFRSVDGVRNISVAPDFSIRWVFPDEPGNRKVIGNNILEDKRPGFSSAVRRAIDSHRIAVHEPVELIQGGMGIIARQAVYRDDHLWGAVGLVFLVEPMVRQAGLDMIDSRMLWGVRTLAGAAVAGNGGVFANDPLIMRINLPEGYWELGVAPAVGWESLVRKSFEYRLLQGSLLLTGVVSAFLLAGQIRKRGQLNDVVRQRTAELTAAQEKLEYHSRDLGRAHEELERFAYVAAHDLQEPLRSITSFSQLILRNYKDKLDDEGREWLSQVIGGGQRMRLLLRDVQLYLAESSLPLPSTPFPAEEAVREAMAKMPGSIREKGAKINVLPLPEVMADRRRMIEIMQVLLSNALEYGAPDRPLEIMIRARRDGGMWIIDVVDNGIGIEPEYLRKIFEVFQRLHGRQDHPGTGMGLAIARKMAMRLGGAITVSSTPGQGSCFSLHLPGA